MVQSELLLAYPMEMALQVVLLQHLHENIQVSSLNIKNIKHKKHKNISSILGFLTSYRYRPTVRQVGVVGQDLL